MKKTNRKSVYRVWVAPGREQLITDHGYGYFFFDVDEEMKKKFGTFTNKKDAEESLRQIMTNQYLCRDGSRVKCRMFATVREAERKCELNVHQKGAKFVVASPSVVYIGGVSAEKIA